jgi:hypothetical protein
MKKERKKVGTITVAVGWVTLVLLHIRDDPGLYLGRYWLSSLKFCAVFLGLSRQIPYYLKLGPSRFFPILFSSLFIQPYDHKYRKVGSRRGRKRNCGRSPCQEDRSVLQVGHTRSFAARRQCPFRSGYECKCDVRPCNQCHSTMVTTQKQSCCYSKVLKL